MNKHSTRILSGALLLSLLLIGVASGTDNSTIDYDPTTGYYTRYWIDFNEDLIDEENFFTTIFKPITDLIGNWFYFIIWGLFVFLVGVKSQSPVLPAVSSLGIGSIMAAAFPEESFTIIIFIMIFTAAPILVFLFKDRD